MKRSATRRTSWAVPCFLLAYGILQGCGSTQDNTAVTARNFLYVADYRDNTVASYSVSSTGALVPILGGSVPTGGGPIALAADPAGRFLYSADRLGNTISIFAVRDDGVLQRSGAAATGVGPQSLAIAVPSSGRLFVYSANIITNDLSAFEVTNPVTGQLSPLTPRDYPTGNGPRAVTSARTPSAGTFVYVANGTDGSISAFSVADTGALSPVPGSPFTGSTPFVSPVSLASDPAGGFLYVADGSAARITGFRILPATGVLLELLFSPWVTGFSTPRAIAVDNTGNALWVAQASSLSRFPIESTGTFAGNLRSPPSPGSDNSTVLYGSVAVDAAGRFAYATDDPFATPTGNRVHGFVLQDNGGLVPAPGMPLASGNGPSAVAVIGK